MQRDWDLIREILTVLEARDTTHGGLAPDAFSNHSKELVSYHFYLLDQAGLIDADIKKTANTGIFGIARNLTWEGHELLDKMRSDTLWKKITTSLKDKGLELSFEAIKTAATVGTPWHSRKRQNAADMGRFRR
jgi:hypothetical protein